MLELAIGVRPRPKCTDCVVLTCFTLEFEFMAAMLRQTGVRLYQAGGLDEADFLLTATDATVLLCDTVFPDGCWNDCLRMIAHVHPSVSLVVVADEQDQSFVAPAVAGGAAGILWKPVRISELQLLIERSHKVALTRSQALRIRRDKTQTSG
jgi:DNA-binding NtrC family response regulator